MAEPKSFIDVLEENHLLKPINNKESFITFLDLILFLTRITSAALEAFKNSQLTEFDALGKLPFFL
jgi:hypothetical protein